MLDHPLDVVIGELVDAVIPLAKLLFLGSSGPDHVFKESYVVYGGLHLLGRLVSLCFDLLKLLQLGLQALDLAVSVVKVLRQCLDAQVIEGLISHFV